MKDLQSERLMWLKGWLFVVIGLVSAALVILENPTARTTLFLVLTMWAFCRAYYFAYYVIEHYIDPGFKYAGLLAFANDRLLGRRPETAFERMAEACQREPTSEDSTREADLRSRTPNDQN